VGDGAKVGSNAVVVKDVPSGATAVGIPARVIDENSKGGHEGAKQKFAAYGIGADMNDPMVKALHGLIDHTANVDQRIEFILAQLKRLGVKTDEAAASEDQFDPAYLNRIVD
jgi:serine O-acetyltransferase